MDDELNFVHANYFKGVLSLPVTFFRKKIVCIEQLSQINLLKNILFYSTQTEHENYYDPFLYSAT